MKKEKEKKESNPPIKPTRGITLGWVGLDRVRHALARGTFLNLYYLTFSRPISLNRPYQAIINVSFAGPFNFKSNGVGRLSCFYYIFTV